MKRIIVLLILLLSSLPLAYAQEETSDFTQSYTFEDTGHTISFPEDWRAVQDDEGVTYLTNDDYYSRVCAEVVRLLTTHTDRGHAYRVDLRLRPEGHRGPLARSLASTLSYYDTLGRTWERQALIKLRPVAGNG